MMVTFEKSAVPLPACMADFRDFVIYNTRKFFENEFQGKLTYPVWSDTGEPTYVELEDPMIAFSEEKIKHEMHRFLHGYNNRFVPVELPVINTKPGQKYYMRFDGTSPESVYHRRLTWLDVFFIATYRSVKDKQVLITRFPINLFESVA